VDDIANQTLEKGKSPSVFGFEKGRYLTAYAINDENGASERKIIIKEGAEYCPSGPLMHFLSDSEYIFWGWKFPSQGGMPLPNTVPIGAMMSPIPNSAKAGAIVKGTLPN